MPEPGKRKRPIGSSGEAVLCRLQAVHGGKWSRDSKSPLYENIPLTEIILNRLSLAGYVTQKPDGVWELTQEGWVHLLGDTRRTR